MPARSRMRVLFVTSMWPSEGEPWRGSFVESQAKSLAGLGVRVDLSEIRARGSWRAYLEEAVRAIRSNSQNTYDVIHAHYGHAGMVARLRVRAPLVISYCGNDLLPLRRQDGAPLPQSRVEVAVFRQLARFAQATITKSREMELCLPVGCRRRNTVIPNGVDLSRFTGLTRATARRTLGWPDAQRVVLFVGDPNFPVKNYPLAAAVCNRAQASHPGLTLKVAWGVHPDEIPTWMSAADALLLTSQTEGSPNVIKEAMAAGLPIVSTPVGDVAERLGGVDGCFVRAPDVRALSEALSVAVRYGRSTAAQEAVTELGLQVVASRVLAVYELARRRAEGKPVG